MNASSLCLFNCFYSRQVARPSSISVLPLFSTISFLRRALEEQTIQNTFLRRLPCPSSHRCCFLVDLRKNVVHLRITQAYSEVLWYSQDPWHDMLYVQYREAS